MKRQYQSTTVVNKMKRWLIALKRSSSLLIMLYVLYAGNIWAENTDTLKKNKNKPVTISITVIPFNKLTSIKEFPHLANDIHEYVLNNLSQIKNINLIPYHTILKNVDTEVDLSRVGNEIGVDYIVEGSVRKINNKIRVIVVLKDAHNKNHLWSNNFERKTIDIFSTKNNLAKDISNSIYLEIKPQPFENTGAESTNSFKAYKLYKKSISTEKNEGRSKDALFRRKILLEEAVKEDPNLVEAWATLKRLYDYMLLRIKTRGWYVNEGMDKDEVIKEYKAKSKLALDQALLLDPDHTETLLATVIDYDWNKPVEELKKQKVILELIITENPKHAKAWYHLGWWYEIVSRKPDQNIETMRAQSKSAFKQALVLDPYNARIIDALLNLSRRKGYDDLIKPLLERLKQVNP